MPRKSRQNNKKLLKDEVAISNADMLKDICGPHHEHLGLIENSLSDYDVLLDSAGGKITIEAKEEGLEKVRAIITQLQTRYMVTSSLSKNEIEAALNLALDNQLTGEGLKGLKLPVNAETSGQKMYLKALLDETSPLVFGVGPAGTGKTYLAVAVGVAALKQGWFKRLVITRPAVEAGERLGFLPGDLEDKIDPYLQPIWDALREFLGAERVERMRARGEIEMAPLAFMRGRTLKDAFVIVDEAQNATIMQMKMVLTRLGRDSQMVVTGDPGQSDLPEKTSSGLAHALEILSDIEGVSISTLTAKDVRRHELVGRIINAYEKSKSS